MNVKFTLRAARVIDNVAAFVESKNTPGSGGRYALKFKTAIQEIARPNVQYALCAHPALAQLKYSCFNFNGWVIVFKIDSDVLTVYRIIHGSMLF